jgi:tetratricopeptide (TPR) repeat protein
VSTVKRWHEVEELFAFGLERDPASRAADIASRCGGDEELAREVESLIRAHEISSEFLATAVTERLASAEPEPDDRIGGRIGRYRIVRELGRGGMGTVYEALQDDPRREVALKIVRGGALADAQHVRRFRREAESLARLDHPGIARILEAGVDPKSGEHWFAMELVRGRPLTEWVRIHAPSRAQRLELFVAICRAVEHAHRQGIVHRDLKPSNLLVTHGDVAGVKVLDFGLAHCAALEGGPEGARVTRITEPGRIFGTLPYMSPEQASGDLARVGPPSDVYALGVVLYELLTGRLPLDVDGVHLPEAVRRITESEPDRPSRFDRSLRGDIDTILGKALEKDPDRRYASASALADDLERHAALVPIVARAPSFTYQTKKLVLRHKVFFGGAALVFVLMAAAAVFAGFLYARAREAEQRALEQADTATVISSFLQDMIASAEPGRVSPHELSMREALDTAAARLDAVFPDRPLVASALHTAIGDAYSGLGQFDRAAHHLEKALALQRATPGDDNGLASALIGLGRLRFLQGRYAEAETHWREALGLRRRIGANGPLVVALSQLAGAVRQRSTTSSAMAEVRALYEEALAIVRADTSLDRALEGDVLNEYGGLLSARGQREPAEKHLRRALELHTQRYGAHDMRVAQDQNDLAVFMSRGEKLDEAITLLRSARATVLDILGPRHPTTMAMTNNLGSFLVRKGETEEGVELLTEVLAMRRSVLGADHPEVAATLNHLGHAERKGKKLALARAHFEEALALNRARFGETHMEVANSLSNLALLELDMREPAAALPHAREALAVYSRVLPIGHIVLPQSLGLLGQVYMDLEEWSEAEPLLVESVNVLARTQPRGDPGLSQAAERLAKLYDATGRTEEARKMRESGGTEAAETRSPR